MIFFLNFKLSIEFVHRTWMSMSVTYPRIAATAGHDRLEEKEDVSARADR